MPFSPLPREQTNPPLLIRFPWLAGAFVAISIFFTGGYLSWSAYDADVRSSEQLAQWAMVNQAVLISGMVDGDIHKGFTAPEQAQSPEYQAIRAKLEAAIVNSKRIKYIYTYILQDGELRYIFDVEDSRSPDASTENPLMSLEKEEPGKMRAAILARQAFAETRINRSAWGDLISAYAPIHDSTGRFVAMLGIDLTAEDYTKLTSSNLARLIDTLLIYTIFSFLAGAFAYLLTKRLKTSLRKHELLHRDASRFVHAVQSTRDGVFLFDKIPSRADSGSPQEQFVLAEVNDAACTMCQLPRLSLLGLSPDETLPFARRIGLSDKIQQSFSLQQVIIDTIQTKHYKNFLPEICEIIISPREGGVVTFLRNITEREHADSALKESQKQMTLLAQALRYSPNGVMIADATAPDMPIIFVNRTFSEITGYSESEALGKNLRILQGRDTIQPALQVLRKAIRMGESCRVLLRNYRKDGMLFWNDLSLSPLMNEAGAVTHFVGMMNNVTEHKNSQEMLQFTNQELHRKNAALDDALIAANQAANAKRSFLSNISHEIRTPMNGVVGMADLMEDTPLNAVQKNYLAVLKESSKTIVMIISDILDFSRIDAGQMSLYESWFAPSDLIGNLIQDVKYSAEAKDLTMVTRIDKDVPKAIYADYERLKQILENYMDNAVKFSHHGTIIAGVKAVYVNKDSKHAKLLFFVTDDGIGISEADKAKVFDTFLQLDSSRTRHYAGTGLGLAICRKIAQLMRGDVGFQSVEGQGSTFWFEGEFTFGSAQAVRRIHQHLPADLSAVRFDGKSALLVEDNAISLMVAKAMLEKLGFAVTTALTGQDAVQRFEQQRFDVVLMDIQLPVMDGIAATRTIRSFEASEKRNEPTPILGITADVQEAFRERCFEAGMNDYLAKPLEKNKLIAMLALHVLMQQQGPAPDKAAASTKQQNSALQFATEALLDRTQLDSIYGMLGAKISVLAERFDSDTRAQLAKMQDALNAKDFGAVSAIGHSLKSSASNIGANQLSAIFRHIELHAVKQADTMQDCHAEACRNLEQVVQALNDFVKTKQA